MPTRDEAQRRHAVHYALLLAAMKRDFENASGGDEVVTRFDGEWGQLRVGQAWAAEAAERGIDDRDLAFLYASHSDPLVGLRHPPSVVRSWITPALSHDQVRADPGHQAEQLLRLGQTHFNAGEFERARDLWRQAVEIHERLNPNTDARYVAVQRAGYEANIGMAEERLGRREAARTALENAQEIFARHGETEQEGRMWLNLGTLHAEEDAHDKAIEDYQRAAAIARASGDIEGLELALGATGNSLADLGRLAEARATLEEALSLTRTRGDKAGEGMRLGNLAKVALDEGDCDRALSRRSEALAIARQMGDRRSEALQLHGIGQVHIDSGSFEEAILSFSQALRIFDEIGMSDAASKADRGVDSAKRHSLQKAIDAYKELIAVSRYDDALEELARWQSLGHETTPYMKSVLLGLEGFGEHIAGHVARAAELFAEALRLDRDLPASELQAGHLGNVGDLYRQLGDARHAELLYRAALNIADVSDAVRTKLATGLRFAQELDVAGPPLLDPALAIDAGLELVNRGLSGGDTYVTVRYEGGFSLTGRSAQVELGSGLPVITLELPGGLPLQLAFDRISAIEVLP